MELLEKIDSRLVGIWLDQTSLRWRHNQPVVRVARQPCGSLKIVLALQRFLEISSTKVTFETLG